MPEIVAPAGPDDVPRRRAAPSPKQSRRHGTLEVVARRYPARHYVLVEDKLRILATVKQAWGPRVTPVFARQGQYARVPQVRAAYPPADLSVGRITDLLELDATLQGRPATDPPQGVRS